MRFTFTVEDVVHKAFKLYCLKKGVPMAEELREMMLERISEMEGEEVVYSVNFREQTLKESSDG